MAVKQGGGGLGGLEGVQAPPPFADKMIRTTFLSCKHGDDMMLPSYCKHGLLSNLGGIGGRSSPPFASNMICIL